MFRNQYCLSLHPRPGGLEGFRHSRFGAYHVYAHEVLPVSAAVHRDRQVMILGPILDPDHPEADNEAVAGRLAHAGETVAAWLNALESMSGRFVALYQNEESICCTTDACGLRRVFYASNAASYDPDPPLLPTPPPSTDRRDDTHTHTLSLSLRRGSRRERGYSIAESREPDDEWDDESFSTCPTPFLTSSVKLFLYFHDLSPCLDEETAAFLASPEHLGGESAWIGDEGPDMRLRRLLPNHCLDLRSGRIDRVPFTVRSGISQREVIVAGTRLLRGTYQALLSRYDAIQPLTAGWDSRLLLAASRPFRERIRYYVFDRSAEQDARQPVDVAIARGLAGELGLRFEAIRPSRPTPELVALLKREMFQPRLLGKTANLQHHLDHNADGRTINLNGNGGEVTRCFYGRSRTRPGVRLGPRMLSILAGFGADHPFVTPRIRRWMVSALPFARRSGVGLLDLFYWEQRMGNWGAIYPREQDIALEECSPLNNRALYALLLGLPARERSAPGFRFYRAWIEHLWPETLEQPINPGGHPLKGLIKGSAELMTMVNWWRSQRRRQ